MKKILFVTVSIIFILAGISAWILFSSATAFTEKSVYILVPQKEHTDKQVMEEIMQKNILKSPSVFNFLATKTNTWQQVKSGRFKINQGENLYSILRKLKNNQQEQSKLVINKFRVPADLAKLIGKNFSIDSAHAMLFLNNPDSLKEFGVDTTTLFYLVIPDTYFFYWNTPVKDILSKLKKESDAFWQKNHRLEKAAALGLSRDEVYTLASIVEEETRNNDEKDTIASVYINRLQAGMPLGADPTIKFALKDFGLKRILLKHLTVASPFNTYKNKGLPPGPICTPSPVTIDATLDAPKTDYFYFVAKSDFTEGHHFSKTYAEHLFFANEYQRALDILTTNKKTETK
ncbi:MAG: endolytic transglycosylase MltG [Bacteroidota bacterium]